MHAELGLEHFNKLDYYICSLNKYGMLNLLSILQFYVLINCPFIILKLIFLKRQNSVETSPIHLDTHAP